MEREIFWVIIIESFLGRTIVPYATVQSVKPYHHEHNKNKCHIMYDYDTSCTLRGGVIFSKRWNLIYNTSNIREWFTILSFLICWLWNIYFKLIFLQYILYSECGNSFTEDRFVFSWFKNNTDFFFFFFSRYYTCSFSLFPFRLD